jgi:hypothetical protein
MAGSAPLSSDTPEVVVFDDRPLPRVCAVCGEPATTTVPVAYSLREPAYHLMLLTGVVMGLFIATWMMMKVRPTITHELPAAVSFILLFLATFAPVWIVASFTSRHKGTLPVPACAEHTQQAAHTLTIRSKGDGKLGLTGLHSTLARSLATLPPRTTVD